ncbi:putative ArsR family transcriptional regulator [Actinomadura namibiensis]|uniref:Putative ArsR family transcriptional regulator n=2 Tax=Actinomadura TaxID=1988 RepID=A0A7W3LRV3_ACTNM|nr:putative ArsR family transcriptional regulator [Actinomadura namibiensis]
MRVLWSRRSATAIEIAEVVGESTANCFRHLRQLAEHGFVEEEFDGLRAWSTRRRTDPPR